MAISSYGTLLQLGDGGSPETFTTVPGVGDIEGPSITMEEIEVTSHSTAASGAWQDYLPTTIDPGELSITFFFDPNLAIHRELLQIWLDREERNWRVRLPSNAMTITARGYIKDGPFSLPVKGAVTQKLTIRLKGYPAPQFTY